MYLSVSPVKVAFALDGAGVYIGDNFRFSIISRRRIRANNYLTANYFSS